MEMDIDQFCKESSYHVDKLLDLIDLSCDAEKGFKMALEIGIQLIASVLLAYRGAEGECEMGNLTETVVSEIYRRIDSGIDAENFNYSKED